MYDMNPNEIDDENPIILDTPIGLIPDLSLWGIEEGPEPGTCEDTYENRKLLRENKATWTLVYAQDGSPTNFIQVVTSEMKQARLLANKSVLLKDPRDPDSDYITGFSLIIEPRADNMVPAWVIAATRKWEDISEERAKRGPEGKVFRPAVEGPPSRCRARRMDGKRCQNWTGGLFENDGLCKTHISTKASAPDNFGSNRLQRARNRLISAAEGAVEGLEELATSATSEPVRLGAYKEILDRAGVRGGFEIDQNVKVDVTSAEQIVLDRLKEIAKRSAQREIMMNPKPTPEPEEIVVVVEEDSDDAR